MNYKPLLLLIKKENRPKGLKDYAIAEIRQRYQEDQCGDALAERADLAAEIAEKAINGRIKFVTNGMDCDGCAWEGRGYDIAANAMAVEKAIKDLYEGAEGPVGYYLAKPDAQIKETHRDLGMEAYENGHPHVIYY